MKNCNLANMLPLLCEKIDKACGKAFNISHAGVVEVADAPDSKSGDPRGHAGSSPASGILNNI